MTDNPIVNVIQFPTRRKDDYLSSLEISRQANLTHRWIKQSIKNHLKSLEHGGPVRIVGAKIYLNLPQAWLFMGYLRNTEASVRLKMKVAHDFADACGDVGLNFIDVFLLPIADLGGLSS